MLRFGILQECLVLCLFVYFCLLRRKTANAAFPGFWNHLTSDFVEQVWVIPAHRRSQVRLKISRRTTTFPRTSTPLPGISTTTLIITMTQLQKRQSVRMRAVRTLLAAKMTNMLMIFPQFVFREYSTSLVSDLPGYQAIHHVIYLTSPTEESQADGLCKRTTSDGKCNCPVCSKKSFDKDLRELVNFDIPDAPHVFAFHMPPDGISGQLDSNSFSNDMSLLQPPPGSSHNRLRPINRELCRNKSGKRGRLGEKSPDANVMALMKEVLQSGGTLSPELLIRIQHSVDKGERSHHPNSTMLSSRRQETGFASPSFSPNPFMSMRHPTSESSSHRQGARVASSSYYSAAPFMDAGGARNELQPRHQETGLASSSANSTPFMGVGRSMNENIPSDFNLFTTSQSQSASSVSSILSSRSHDSKTTNNTLVGSRRTRQSNFTLYQCTFKLCDKTFPSKSDWKRHEESVHKQRYMCMECGTGLADPRGGYACGLCWAGPFASLDAVKIHTIQCEEAQKVGKSFARKDKLRNHLREDHGQLIFSEDAFSWVYDVDSDWPRECGFCGDPLNDVCIFSQHFRSPFGWIRKSRIKYLTPEATSRGVKMWLITPDLHPTSHSFLNQLLLTGRSSSGT